ncbi:MAG: hypothetical protein KDA79_17300, partial [Planctomycetaceae bacterium]|nr:hypothetical protein [Planctomycetaceae bacterium]
MRPLSEALPGLINLHPKPGKNEPVDPGDFCIGKDVRHSLTYKTGQAIPSQHRNRNRIDLNRHIAQSRLCLLWDAAGNA